MVIYSAKPNTKKVTSYWIENGKLIIKVFYRRML